jgi:hypothetical protein
MKRLLLLVMVVCLAALSGCAVGSYRGIRVAEEGKWEFTPYVGLPSDGVGIKIATGISERSEVWFGTSTSYTPGYITFIPGAAADAGGKYLILDEKTSNDFMSLAIGGGGNFFIPAIDYSSLDLEIIGGKTLGKYTEDNLPGNVYLGLGVRGYPLFEGGYSYVWSRKSVGWRIFTGGEIPFGTEFVLTPELALLLIVPRIYPCPPWCSGLIFNAGVGFTFRP